MNSIEAYLKRMRRITCGSILNENGIGTAHSSWQKMFKAYTFIMFIVATLPTGVCSTPETKNQRQIPVVVSIQADAPIVEKGKSIPLTITVWNNLPSSINYLAFSLVPNEWNGETANISLVEIYRKDTQGNLYHARPNMNVPLNISGMGRQEIKSEDTLVIRIDASKWKLRDGWLSGRYKITVRVDRLIIDEYSTLSVLSDPIEFEIE